MKVSVSTGGAGADKHLGLLQSQLMDQWMPLVTCLPMIVLCFFHFTLHAFSYSVSSTGCLFSLFTLPDSVTFQINTYMLFSSSSRSCGRLVGRGGVVDLPASIELGLFFTNHSEQPSQFCCYVPSNTMTSLFYQFFECVCVCGWCCVEPGQLLAC